MLVFLRLESLSLLFYLLLYLCFYLLLLFCEVFEIEEEGHGWELLLALRGVPRPNLIVVHEGHPFGDIVKGIISNSVIGILNSIEDILR